MRYLMYFMIGFGLSQSNHYASLPLLERFVVYVAWPAVIARDVANEVGSRTVARAGDA